MNHAIRTSKSRAEFHIVLETDPDLTGSPVANVALCGKRGPWPITLNLGLGNVCKRCLRARKQMRG